jgi:hypothetical protein
MIADRNFSSSLAWRRADIVDGEGLKFGQREDSLAAGGRVYGDDILGEIECLALCVGFEIVEIQLSFVRCDAKSAALAENGRVRTEGQKNFVFA